MAKDKENFLDYTPVRNPDFAWTEEAGVVTVDMVHQGVYAAIAQRLFRRPRISHVKLDEYGSFLWRHMDGQTDVGALGKLLEAQFGEGAQPLYPRLVKYVKILLNNKFIALKKP